MTHNPRPPSLGRLPYPPAPAEPQDPVRLLQDYSRAYHQAMRLVPLFPGIGFGVLVWAISDLSAGTALGGPWATGTSVTAIILLVAVEIAAYMYLVHWTHERQLGRLGKTLGSRSTPIKGGDGTLKTEDKSAWVSFLQSRADSASAWIQSLVTLSALIPVATLTQTIPPLHADLFTAIAAGIIAGLVTGFVTWAVLRLLRRRDVIMLLQSFVNGDVFASNKLVLGAFLNLLLTDREEAAGAQDETSQPLRFSIS